MSQKVEIGVRLFSTRGHKGWHRGSKRVAHLVPHGLILFLWPLTFWTLRIFPFNTGEKYFFGALGVGPRLVWQWQTYYKVWYTKLISGSIMRGGIYGPATVSCHSPRGGSRHTCRHGRGWRLWAMQAFAPFPVGLVEACTVSIKERRWAVWVLRRTDLRRISWDKPSMISSEHTPLR